MCRPTVKQIGLRRDLQNGKPNTVHTVVFRDLNFRRKKQISGTFGAHRPVYLYVCSAVSPRLCVGILITALCENRRKYSNSRKRMLRRLFYNLSLSVA